MSIIVPMADDEVDGEMRVAIAHAQTWKNIEVLPVYSCKSPFKPVVSDCGSLAKAIHLGKSASKGDFISLLLPGAAYTSDKITRQVAFVEKFELQDAVVFCDYTLFDGSDADGVPIALPSLDPSIMFRKIYCGLPLDFSSLFIPRKAMDKFELLDEDVGIEMLHRLVLVLSQHMPFVGMAEQLVSITNRNRLSSIEKVYLRDLYVRLLPEILSLKEPAVYDADFFTALGDATVARLTQRLPLAAWETFRAALRLLRNSSNGRRALLSFAKPLLRSAFHSLPVSAKRLFRSNMQRQIDTESTRLDFSAIYRFNGFVGTESLSGAGATRFQTRIIRSELPKIFRQLGVKSIVDIPCGDFHWMRDVDLVGIHYTGADLVDEMVSKNQRLFGGSDRVFRCVNLISGPLPEADLVFCRDCLVHLPYEDALAAIETIRKSKCQWLLTTTFTRTTPNTDLDATGWRALNLTLPPFNFPQPSLLISEKCTEAGGLAGDKSLGLWRIADLQPRERA